MTALHPATSSPTAPSTTTGPAPSLDLAGAGDTVVALDAAAAHLDDALDRLGTRASSLSLGAAARRVDEGLRPASRALRRGLAEDEVLAPQLRRALTQLQQADLQLAQMSRAAMGIVPPSGDELSSHAAQLRAWSSAARVVATAVAAVLAAR